MKRNDRVPVALGILCALIIPLQSCGKRTQVERDARAYGTLIREAVALYSRMEPLRSSRLGLVASDSLLFTFSDGEVSRALEDLARLEDRFSKFPASRLAQRDRDNAEVITYWLRGERFALREMQSFRYNPLLYCETVEEALWGLPNRIREPYADELGAYRARLRRIPALLANARRLLENPAEAHVRYAAERLDSIAEGIDRLGSAIGERYGQPAGPELDAARRSIEAFRRFFGDSLLLRSRGRMIIGAENLSKVFLYDEAVDADPNTMIGKAEALMRRLKSTRSSFTNRIEFETRGLKKRGTGAPSAMRTAPSKKEPTSGEVSGARPEAHAARGREPFEATVNRLLDRLAGKGTGDTLGGGGGSTLVIRYPARMTSYPRLPKNSCLTTAPVERPEVVISFTEPFDGPPCLSYGLFSSEARRLGENELLMQLLRATPAVLESDSLRCQERDTLRTIFSSETFREGWLYVNTRERATSVRTDNPQLSLLLLDEEIAALARTVVVLRVHAGSVTSEEAAEYLVQWAGMSREAAAKEVLAATLSPGIAYPGMAMVAVDNMIETISYLRGLDRSDRKLRAVFRENRDLPLAIIEEKISNE